MDDIKERTAEGVAELFNTICGFKLSNVHIKLISDTRRRLISQRRNDLKAIDMSFEDYFNKVIKSDFLCGSNSRGWRANFDWLLKSANFIKVIEGHYDNKKPINQLQSKPTYDLEDYKKYAADNTEI